MTRTQATPPSYFDDLWAGSDDPWDHGGRWYEARKYGLTVAALPRPRYRHAFEPGCGAGYLSRLLVERCDRLTALELHPRGVEATRRRLAGTPGWSEVDVRQGRLPHDWPADGDGVDLVVLSEVLYYLDDGDLDAALDRAAAARAAGADVVSVHYRHPVAEHVRLGDEVHERLAARLGPPLVTHVDPDFRLDVHADPQPAP